MRAVILTFLAFTAAAGCQKQAAAPQSETPQTAEAAAPAPAAATDIPATSPQYEPSAQPVSILLFVDADGVAVSGYDPVSYFAEAPAVGDPAIASLVDGATYRFATAENKAAFDADPAKYQPQYGGYCAYGASQGAKFQTVPETGAVVNGKLYFNKNKSVQTMWNDNRDALIVAADGAWPSIAYDAPKE